ncbi:S-layer homology domain-containing protein [Butyricicoccus faecihominis]|uniref:S-layer homology domain-containing protein n=1 Tax=Butyricicoccus faecihominis TaxID=1712515 RepID=UPI0024792C84|nr:S-layer homology domain-containing protein [Butyricicoccus faecihominis]MCQ5128469.1 S-layer homology domain-containing protein [Butyricicoccus faecihominis]
MKLHRKLAGLVSAAVVLSSLSVGAFAASPSDFADMPSDWSRPALENAINNGLLNGSDGKINASGLLTRAELAAIVNRAFGATKTADISSYTDVPASAWYYADMQKAVHMGTFEGSNGKLSPASAITRQEAFTVLARAFSLADGSASSLSKFSDASAVSSWAKGPVAALTEAGYVNGSGGKLNPTASITRAEFAQIADNLVSAYLPKEYTGTADGNAMVREAGAVLDKADIKGDLILGDGVGDGNVTIRDSKVSGRLVVRGGGVHSIIISGSTEIGTVVVSKVDGNVRVATEGNAKVQTIVVDDGKDDVIIEGTVGKVEIASANVPVVLQNAKVDEVVVSAAGADVTVDKNSTVKTVTVDSAAANTALTVAGKVDTVAVQGDNATVTAEKGATIAKVQTAAANTEVKGDGKVTKVEAQAGSTGAKVTTPGTSITVDKGADAVKTDKGTVEPGKTGSTSGTTTGGGGGGGGGGSSAPSAESLRADLLAAVKAKIPEVNDNMDYATLLDPEAVENSDIYEVSVDVEIYDVTKGLASVAQDVLSPVIKIVQDYGQITTIKIADSDNISIAADNADLSTQIISAIKGWIPGGKTLADVVGKDLTVTLNGSSRGTDYSVPYTLHFKDMSDAAINGRAQESMKAVFDQLTDVATSEWADNTLTVNITDGDKSVKDVYTIMSDTLAIELAKYNDFTTLKIGESDALTYDQIKDKDLVALVAAIKNSGLMDGDKKVGGNTKLSVLNAQKVDVVVTSRGGHEYKYTVAFVYTTA